MKIPTSKREKPMNEPEKALEPIRTFHAKYGLSLSKLAGGEVVGQGTSRGYYRNDNFGMV